MTILLNILAFIVVLGAIVAIHELGHLIFAKRANILCYEYSLGFGPVLYGRKGKETDFSIRAIPLGGFVSMAGEQISTEMIKKGDFVGLNFKDGKIKEIILTNEVKAELTLRVSNYEVYDEKEEGYLFIEGLVDDELEHFEILEDAKYIITPKQKLQIAPYNRCFESKTFLERLLTLLAGPFMNFFFALFLFLIVASIQGKPQNTSVIGDVVDYYPAALAGIQKNDEIISIGGNEISNWDDLNEVYLKLDTYEDVEIILKREGSLVSVNFDFAIEIARIGLSNISLDGIAKNESVVGASVGAINKNIVKDLQKGDVINKVEYGNEEIDITNWYDLVNVVDNLPKEHKEIKVTFIRGEEEKTSSILVWEPAVLKSQGADAYQIAMGIEATRKFSLGYSLTQPFVEMWNSFYRVVLTIGLLFGGSSQIGAKDLNGPVGIFNIVGHFRSQGFLALASFAAFLSVNIGILNLLPIPALDGGRILFISIESITKKKISRKTENIINNVFFFLLMALFLYVTINDILKIF